MRTQLKNSYGFTLIELLVGMALSAIVLAGVLSVYIPALRSWGTSADLAEIHDTQSILHETLGVNLRQAGLLGCNASPTTSNVIDGINITNRAGDVNAQGWAFSLSSAAFANPSFRVYAANANAAITNTLGNLQGERLTDASNRAIGDVFYTLAPSTGYYRITGGTASDSPANVDPGPNKILTLTDGLSANPVSIAQDSFYIINDCNNPVVVMASANSTAGLLQYTNNQLNNVSHPVGTVVNPFQPAIYYIGAFTPNGSTTAIPTLYRRTITRNPIGSGPFVPLDSPILTGVENMRIEYGIFTLSSGNPYITNYVTQLTGGLTMADVSAVRISVMIQSAGNNNSAQQTELWFPDLTGTLVNCFAGTPDPNACPGFVTSTAGRQRSHKVVQYTYALPRVERIKQEIEN